MGNCQAIDNAAILIQHPNGKTDKLSAPVPAAQVMKTNPGHCVALLLTTTTVYPAGNRTAPLRIARIKLLRPADALALGHVYRLVTTQEATWAKKQQQQQKQSHSGKKTVTMREKNSSEFEVNEERQSSRNKKPAVSSKCRGAWQPALKSISESAT